MGLHVTGINCSSAFLREENNRIKSYHKKGSVVCFGLGRYLNR